MSSRMAAALLLAALLAVPSAAQDEDAPAGKGFMGRLIKHAKASAGSPVLDTLGEKAGLSHSQTEGIVKTTKAFRKSAQDISESEEYFIGRSVAAQILARYKPYQDEKANGYLQSVVQVVAMGSDRPSIYHGYHAQVLDSAEVNAFAAPGGFIFVTRGLLKLLENEDQLACVVAHELAHISEKHGLKTIKASRLTQAFSILGQEVAKDRGSPEFARLTEAFGGSVDDIVNKLVVNGYSRDKEFEADQKAVVYARRANYHPKGLTRFLSRLGEGQRSGLLKTHPSQSQRLEKLSGADLSPSGDFKVSQARRERFAAAVSGL